MAEAVVDLLGAADDVVPPGGEAGVPAVGGVVLDHDPDNIEVLRRLGETSESLNERSPVQEWLTRLDEAFSQRAEGPRGSVWRFECGNSARVQNRFACRHRGAAHPTREDWFVRISRAIQKMRRNSRGIGHGLRS